MQAYTFWALSNKSHVLMVQKCTNHFALFLSMLILCYYICLYRITNNFRFNFLHWPQNFFLPIFFFIFFFREKYGKTAFQMSVKVMSTIAVEQRWQDKHTKQCLSFYKKPFCPDCKSGIQGVFTVNGLLFRVHIITGNLYIACWNLPKIEMIRFMLCCSVAAFSHFKNRYFFWLFFYKLF